MKNSTKMVNLRGHLNNMISTMIFLIRKQPPIINLIARMIIWIGRKSQNTFIIHYLSNRSKIKGNIT